MDKPFKISNISKIKITLLLRYGTLSCWISKISSGFIHPRFMRIFKEFCFLYNNIWPHYDVRYLRIYGSLLPYQILLLILHEIQYLEQKCCKCDLRFFYGITPREPLHYLITFSLSIQSEAIPRPWEGLKIRVGGRVVMCIICPPWSEQGLYSLPKAGVGICPPPLVAPVSNSPVK